MYILRNILKCFASLAKQENLSMLLVLSFETRTLSGKAAKKIALSILTKWGLKTCLNHFGRQLENQKF